MDTRFFEGLWTSKEGRDLLKGMTLVQAFKLKIIALVLFLFGSSGFALCIQSFNMYGPAYAPQVGTRTRLASQEILRKSPDCEIVQFQEVWSSAQIKIVLQEMYDQYTISAPNQKYRIGLMTLVKGQIQSENTVIFKENNDGGMLDGVRDLFGVKKAFHVVGAKIDEQKVFIVNVHLHPASQNVRMKQLNQMITWLRAHQIGPIVLSGDFNFEPNSKEYLYLVQGLGLRDVRQFVGQNQLGCTYCQENSRSWLKGDHVFDHILVSPVLIDGASKVDYEINLKGTPDFRLSDHYGVQVNIR